MTLNEEIAQFGGLVGVLLALATLFTSAQAASLDRLREAATPTRERAWREVVLDGALAAVTALLVLAGLPLWVDAASDLRPLADGGPLRSVFVVTWVALVALVAWQVALARAAWQLKERIPRS